METKNNKEMITVNGGCFPISWVRKFFNIETADIKDEAVTEAKLDPTLVSEIQQALKGLEITGDDSSGKITVTTTAGDSIDKALPVANAKQAGLMSGSDYAKLQQSVNNVDVSVGTGSGTITVTQNNGTSTKKTVPAATEQLAGLMSASDKAALGLSFSQGSKTADAEKVSLQLIKNDGDIAVVDIGEATETTAGVMTAQDKQQLNASTSDVAVNAKEATVEFKITTHGAGTATKVIPAATGSAAGVMTATDKQQLGNSVSLLEMQQGASQVDIQVTTNSGSHVTKTVPGATTDLAGLMTATDKANLNATVKSVSGALYSDKIAAKYTKTDGSTVELQIPAATTSAAGVMSAADKTSLNALKETVSTMWANILISEDTRLKFDGVWHDVKNNVPFIIRDWKTFEGCELGSGSYDKFRRFDIRYNGLAKVNRFFVCENVDSKPSISSLDVSCWDTSEMTSAGYMFCKLANVQSLDVAGFDTGKVENMGGMFTDCASLKSLSVGGWDVSKVKFMDNMFRGCSSLEELEGEQYWNPSNVENMGQMFDGCGSLKSVNVMNWYPTSKLYNMGGMFRGCGSLTHLNFGEQFDTSGVKYMDNLFNGCSSMKVLDLTYFNTQSVETMSDMFKDCGSLESLKFGDNFGKMKNSVGTLDLSSLTKWTNDTVRSLSNLYDRVNTTDLGTITIKLSAQTYAVLTTNDIATIESKGYSITK